MIFDEPLVRFGVSGTLISIYAIADHLARRASERRDVPRIPAPRWLAPLTLVSILAFYLTIRPFGQAIAGGIGNGFGILVALGAAALRWRLRRGAASVRHPGVAARMLFYAALPVAVGSLAGWLALTLPAVLASATVCAREDRLRAEREGEPFRRRITTSWRWVPGVW